MKNIIIPKDRVQEFTQRVDKWNEIKPIPTKDGTFTLPIDVLEIRSMAIKGTAQNIREALKKLSTAELTKEDFPEGEIELKIKSK